MKFKPAMWAVVCAPLLFLLLLAGGVRGFSFMRGLLDPSAAEAASPVGQQSGLFHDGTAKDGAAKPVSFKTADKITTAVLQKVVGGQIGALQKKEWRKALSFAAPDFQQQWKPETFGKMIASGYPELTSAKTVGFGPATVSENGTIALVPVIVKNAQKQETRFLYVLSRDAPDRGAKKSGKNATGTWHVSGCQRDAPPPRPQVIPHSLNEA